MKSLTILKMRTDTLSHPDNTRVFQEIYTENSGSMFIYTANSIRAELEHMQTIRKNPDVMNNEILSELIDRHIKNTSSQIQDFVSNGEEVMIAIKKPPSPTPPPATGDEVKSISFFTINPDDRIKLQFNSRPVKIRNSFDNLTKIQTVHIPGKISYNEGDRIDLRLKIAYKERTGIIKTRSVEWVMHF